MSVTALAVLGRGVVDPSTPVARADDYGITRGDGCFEGLRIRRTPHRAAKADGHPRGWIIDGLDGHLARMTRSAAGLGIAFDEPAWRRLVDELGDAWMAATEETGEDEAAVKLVLTRGPAVEGAAPTGFGTISPLAPGTLEERRDGIDVITVSRGTTSRSFADAPWLLGGIKTLSYAVNMAAQREAARLGVHDVIFVTVDGELLEGPTSSVVWASRDAGGTTLRTVSEGPNGILHSITTHTLFERAAAAGWVTKAEPGTVADLRAADVALLVSSVKGPLRLRSVDGNALRTTPVGLEIVAACRRFTDFADPSDPAHPEQGFGD